MVASCSCVYVCIHTVYTCISLSVCVCVYGIEAKRRQLWRTYRCGGSVRTRGMFTTSHFRLAVMCEPRSGNERSRFPGKTETTSR